MAITYFGSASNPTDNGTLAGPTVSVTPPGSMVAGDLCIMTAHYRSASAITLAVGATGGQTWTLETQTSVSSQTSTIAWCQYNGTWSADPSMTVTSGTVALTTTLHVFRPTSGSNTWAVDNAWNQPSYSAPSTPFTVTITGVTTTQASTVAFAAWFSQDDNTWGSLSGAGWSVSGSAQYRNLQGLDQSCAFAYNIQTSAGATNNVSLNQATNGGDGGNAGIISFYETSGGASFDPVDPFGMMGIFGI